MLRISDFFSLNPSVVLDLHDFFAEKFSELKQWKRCHDVLSMKRPREVASDVWIGNVPALSSSLSSLEVVLSDLFGWRALWSELFF